MFHKPVSNREDDWFRNLKLKVIIHAPPFPFYRSRISLKASGILNSKVVNSRTENTDGALPWLWLLMLVAPSTSAAKRHVLIIACEASVQVTSDQTTDT